MSRRFISHDGQLRRHEQFRFSNLSMMKLLCYIFALTLLFLTNPGNNITLESLSRFRTSSMSWNQKRTFRKSPGDDRGSRKVGRSQKDSKRNFLGTISWNLLGLEIDIFQPTYVKSNKRSSIGVNIPNKSSASWTNYIIYSLSADSQGVNLSALGNSFQICRFDGISPVACDWIDEYFCHGMKAFDKGNRPFTALRILEVLKVSSFILSSCSEFGSRICPSASFNILTHKPLHFILSVLDQPSLMDDLIPLNIIVYPSLHVVNRIITRGTTNDDAESFHFYTSVFFLIFLVGGFSNLLASYFLPSNVEGVRGMVGGIAASLGYCVAAAPSMVLVEYLDFNLRSSDIIMSIFIISSLSQNYKVFGFSSFSHGWTIVWVIGSIAGNLMGRYQMDRYYNPSFFYNFFY